MLVVCFGLVCFVCFVLFFFVLFWFVLVCKTNALRDGRVQGEP